MFRYITSLFYLTTVSCHFVSTCDHINPLNAELNAIYHVLALLGARHILHVSGIKVNVVARLIANASSEQRREAPNDSCHRK